MKNGSSDLKDRSNLQRQLSKFKSGHQKQWPGPEILRGRSQPIDDPSPSETASDLEYQDAEACRVYRLGKSKTSRSKMQSLNKLCIETKDRFIQERSPELPHFCTGDLA